MDIIFFIKSVIAGSFLGYLYALFFWYERKKVLQRTSIQSPLIQIVSPIARLALLFLFFYWLLLSQELSVMLIIVTFLISFWIAIISKKA